MMRKEEIGGNMFRAVNYKESRLLLDSVGWPLMAKEAAQGPFQAEHKLRFEFDPLFEPKHFEAHGFTVSLERSGIHRAVDEATDFYVYFQIACKAYQECISLFHTNEAMKLGPPMIVPHQKFFVDLTPTRDFGKPGERLHLSIRGLLLREIL
jgi:hypothetical protein